VSLGANAEYGDFTCVPAANSIIRSRATNGRGSRGTLPSARTWVADTRLAWSAYLRRPSPREIKTYWDPRADRRPAHEGQTVLLHGLFYFDTPTALRRLPGDFRLTKIRGRDQVDLAVSSPACARAGSWRRTSFMSPGAAQRAAADDAVTALEHHPK